MSNTVEDAAKEETHQIVEDSIAVAEKDEQDCMAAVAYKEDATDEQGDDSVLLEEATRSGLHLCSKLGLRKKTAAFIANRRKASHTPAVCPA